MSPSLLLHIAYMLMLAVAIFALPVNASLSDWKLKKSANQIQIYTAVDATQQKWVKAITTVDAPWWSLLNLLRATDEGPEWIDNVLDVTLLSQPDEFTDVVRTRFNAPLWFQNREMVTQSLVSFQYSEQALLIDVEQDLQQPVSDGYTQMQSIQGQWKVMQATDKTSKITWVGTGVAGGKIPDWLAASVMIGSTFRTFKALRIRLLQEKYHVKPLGYILSSKNPQK